MGKSKGYVMEIRICRFCKADAPTNRMVKYGTRHYAHGECLFDARGIAALKRLHDWQLRQMPARVLKKAGMFDEVIRTLTATEESP